VVPSHSTSSRVSGSILLIGRSERVVSCDTVRAFLSDSAHLRCSVFRHFDSDGSGSIDQQELNAALRGFGYNLSRELLELIMIKYSRPYLIYNTYEME